jgi:hypothetical protein
VRKEDDTRAIRELAKYEVVWFLAEQMKAARLLGGKLASDAATNQETGFIHGFVAGYQAARLKKPRPTGAKREKEE